MTQEGKIRETFAQHGVALTAVGQTQYRGDSPFAPPGTGQGKFYVHRLTGLFDCKVSSISGNLQTFFAEKSKRNEANFRGVVAQKLAAARKLPIRALRAWRMGWDGRQYTYPLAAYGDKCYDLRRYQLDGKEKATTGGRVFFGGVVVPQAAEVFLTEGGWDGMALWEMFQVAGEAGGETAVETGETGEAAGEAGAPATVLSVPGAGSFPTSAAAWFAGKKVRVCYDNDEPGRRGAYRIQKALGPVAAELLYVTWPDGLPEGFDVRDFYTNGKTLAEFRTLLKPECPGGFAPLAVPPVEQEIAKLTGPGLLPAEVLKRYRKYLYLPHPEVLDVVYGAVFANRLDGDPIWLFLVAPSGGTKTELILSLSDAPLIRSISSLTPHTLVSGAFRENGGGDPSLLPQLNGRVLCIKDFTTILSMPQQARDEIFGTLREVYDGRFEKSWGTGLARRYDAKFGIIAGVTPLIEKFSASNTVMGERFIKYRIPRAGRLQSDDSIIDAALANLNRETKMRADLQACSKEILSRAVSKEAAPELPVDIRVKVRKLAQWVAALRGAVLRERYTQIVEYKPTAEVGTRLAKQFAKLAQGIALYHYKDMVDPEIYQIVLAIARGTVPDRPEGLIRRMYLGEREAAERGEAPPAYTALELGAKTQLDERTCQAVLMDLTLLRVVKVQDKQRRGRKKKFAPKTKTQFALTRAFKALMDDLDLYQHEGGWQYARKKAKAQTNRQPRPKPAEAGGAPAAPKRQPQLNRAETGGAPAAPAPKRQPGAERPETGGAAGTPKRQPQRAAQARRTPRRAQPARRHPERRTVAPAQG